MISLITAVWEYRWIAQPRRKTAPDNACIQTEL
jgi:hypothetical protein